MLKDKIENLYWKKELSTTEIGQKLNLTVWQIIKRMRKYNIPRRKQWETQKLQFLRSPLSYKKKLNLTPGEKSLHLAGLMLYWAEGAKQADHCVDFANCDQNMVLTFLTFLRKIFRVNESRLRVLLYTHANQDTSKLIKYWSRLLNIPKGQFSKPYVRKDFDVSKTHKMPHGLVHIRYNDKRLLMQIRREIDTIHKSFSKLGWRSGQSHLSVKEAPERAT